MIKQAMRFHIDRLVTEKVAGHHGYGWGRMAAGALLPLAAAGGAYYLLKDKVPQVFNPLKAFQQKMTG